MDYTIHQAMKILLSLVSSIMETFLFFGDVRGGAGTTITEGLSNDEVYIVGMGFRFHVSLNLFVPLLGLHLILLDSTNPRNYTKKTVLGFKVVDTNHDGGCCRPILSTGKPNPFSFWIVIFFRKFKQVFFTVHEW